MMNLVKNILLVHDPLMQRRIDATARHYAPHINFDNYRCFLPVVENIGFELKNNILKIKFQFFKLGITASFRTQTQITLCFPKSNGFLLKL